MGIDKRYRLYVFDLDGTIADTREDLARAFSAAIEEAGYPKPSLAQVTAAVGGGAEKALQLLTGLEGEAVKPLLSRFFTIYGRICADHVTAYPGVPELLARLFAQGALIALVTMKTKEPTRKILSALKIDMLFNDVIAFEDTERRKPDPETLLLLMQKYGVKPEDTLMVGDAATDVRYASAAGADACAMLRGYGEPSALLAAKPKYAINDFSEF